MLVWIAVSCAFVSVVGLNIMKVRVVVSSKLVNSLRIEIEAFWVKEAYGYKRSKILPSGWLKKKLLSSAPSKSNFGCILM